MPWVAAPGFAVWAALLLTSLPGTTRAWSLSHGHSAWGPGPHVASAAAAARTVPLMAGKATKDHEAAADDEGTAEDEHFHTEATELLDLLEVWLRRQAISSVLSRGQATALLEELRGDRRFWAQQRPKICGSYRLVTTIVDTLPLRIAAPVSSVASSLFYSGKYKYVTLPFDDAVATQYISVVQTNALRIGTIA